MLQQTRWLLLSALVVAVDQLSKFLAVRQLDFGEPYHLLPGFNLTLVHNTGAAFSFLQDAGGWQRYFFIVLAVIVSLAVIVWLLRLPRQQHWPALALALILGGALGNLWDRLQLGYVIDFLDVYYGRWHWPVFNVADSAITLGAVLLIINEFRSRPEHG
ncbi:MAG: signal peptidase II [Gammaproteobacteria bacterium]